MSTRENATAVQQVSRMLALVPYVAKRPGISIADLAREFAVDSEQIVKDLNLLMVCGEPGYFPHELIDVVLDEEGGTVSIAYDAGIGAPLRLDPDEAVTLTVALRTLADIPGLVDTDAVRSALAKLEHASGGPSPQVEVAATEISPVLATVQRALANHRRLRLSYYTASRDELTRRDVDPLRLLVVDGHSYLEGYCYLADAMRRFRVDRMEDATELEVAVQPPLFHDDDVPKQLFTPGPAASTITLDVSAAAGWVAEYYVIDSAAPLADPPGAQRIRMSAAHDEMLIRLVMSLGRHAEVLDRPDIVEAARLRATQALAAYR